jgi:hypothetical protein
MRINVSLEGTFSLSTPLLLLGYEYDTKNYLLGADTTAKDSSKQTYLTLFVTVDPSLQLPEPLVIKVSQTSIMGTNSMIICLPFKKVRYNRERLIEHLRQEVAKQTQTGVPHQKCQDTGR